MYMPAFLGKSLKAISLIDIDARSVVFVCLSVCLSRSCTVQSNLLSVRQLAGRQMLIDRL